VILRFITQASVLPRRNCPWRKGKGHFLPISGNNNRHYPRFVFIGAFLKRFGSSLQEWHDSIEWISSLSYKYTDGRRHPANPISHLVFQNGILISASPRPAAHLFQEHDMTAETLLIRFWYSDFIGIQLEGKT